jgi:hypothetical protein
MIWANPFQAFTEDMISEGRDGYAPERIGQVVLTALTTPRPKGRYAPVPGKLLDETLPGMLPRRLLDWLVGRQIGLVKP